MWLLRVYFLMNIYNVITQSKCLCVAVEKAIAAISATNIWLGAETLPCASFFFASLFFCSSFFLRFFPAFLLSFVHLSFFLVFFQQIVTHPCTFTGPAISSFHGANSTVITRVAQNHNNTINVTESNYLHMNVAHAILSTPMFQSIPEI